MKNNTTANRKILAQALNKQAFEIKDSLKSKGFVFLSGAARAQAIKARTILKVNELVISSRVKTEDKIRDKMNRFGESRDKVLDILAHRIIVKNLDQLDKVYLVLKRLGEVPSKQEMILRNGELQFPAIRDYRKKSHAGKSALTSSDYNEAVHMNRKIAGFMCELQIITRSLNKRAFVDRSGNVAHAQFTRRRTKKYS